MKTTTVTIEQDSIKKGYVAKCCSCSKTMELNADSTGCFLPTGPKSKYPSCELSAALVKVKGRKYATTQDAKVAKNR